MSRVRYLAALGGTAGRRAPEPPLLRPPRRLFPHEPPPLEAVPPPRPVEDGPSPEQAVARAEPTAAEPAEPEPVEDVRPLRAPRLDTPLARPPAAPQFDEVVRPSVERVSSPRREPVRAAEAPVPPEARATRAVDPAPPARRDARRKPASLELELARAESAPRSPVALAPSRLQQVAASPPERAVGGERPPVAAARTAGLRIGSIDVTVTPPAPAPREPALTAPPAPVPRPPAPFDSRAASTSRWFGLAQR
jgi:hypothetical protein